MIFFKYAKAQKRIVYARGLMQNTGFLWNSRIFFPSGLRRTLQLFTGVQNPLLVYDSPRPIMPLGLAMKLNATTLSL